MAENDELSPNVKQPGVMFDTQLVELFRPTVDEAFIEHGDVLRSVLVSFDYYGPLNDAPDLNKAIWLGPEGAQQDPAGILGSIGSALQAIAHMFDRGFALRNALREDYEKTLGELHERKKELEQLKNELQSLRGDAGGTATPSEDTA